MRQLLYALVAVVGLATGAATAQQSNVTNSVVIAALQAMGLFGDGYATGQAPVYNATTGQFAGGAPAPGFPLLPGATTCAAPSYSSSAAATTGLAITAVPSWLLCVNGVAVLTGTATAVTLDNAVTFGWSDVIHARDAANTFAQRNGVNEQRFNIYNTYTSPTNNEFLRMAWIGNDAWVATNQAGAGASRNLLVGTVGSGRIRLVTNDAVRWNIGATDGHFTANIDNTYDIGASGDTRPRNVYAVQVIPEKLNLPNTGGAATTGRATLVAGAVTVTTSAATSTANIFLQRMTTGGTPGFSTQITRNNGVSFTITADNGLDTSQYMWWIVEVH